MEKYDYDKGRKKRELLKIFADHKKELINWLRKKSIEPEKILDAEYRKYYQIHKDFNQYYLEKQKTEYKKLLEESLGDLEKQNITLNKFLEHKNHFESLRINLCSLDTNELEQMGTNTAEKYIKAQLFHSLYSYLQDLITGSRMNYLKVPNELRPKIFQVKEGKTEILLDRKRVNKV